MRRASLMVVMELESKCLFESKVHWWESSIWSLGWQSSHCLYHFWKVSDFVSVHFLILIHQTCHYIAWGFVSANIIRPSVDGLCRDGTGVISRDLRTKHVQTLRMQLAWPMKCTKVQTLCATTNQPRVARRTVQCLSILSPLTCCLPP